MGVVERPGHRDGRARRRDEGHRRAHAVFQAAAGQVFHHQVGRAVHLAVVDHPHDVGVRQAGQRARFAVETLEHPLQAGGGEHLHADNLDRHGAAQALVGGAVNHRHAALAQLFFDQVPP